MDLDELRVFVAVVDRGSIAAASKALRFPIATLRRRIDELEVRLGVKLLDRTRSGATPTSAGAVLAGKARGVLSEIHSLTEAVRSAEAEPSGKVGVAIPQGMPPELVGAFFNLTMKLYPKVSWRVRCVDEPALALSDDVHAALCFGDRPPDGPWTTRKLLNVRQWLVAEPGYLERWGTPARVEDLSRHRLLLWERPGAQGDELPLADGSKLSVVPALCMTDIFLLRQCALRGCGIAFVPDAIIPDPLVGDDQLVPVLKDRVRGEIAVWLLARPATWELPMMRLAFEQLAHIMGALQASR